MRDGLKAMLEVVGIELAYARAEIAMSPGIGVERLRVFDHLDAASETLARLLLLADELGIAGGSRQRPQVVRARSTGDKVDSAAENVGRPKRADA